MGEEPAEPEAEPCLWAACDRPATHEGYCEEHRELTAVERFALAHRLQAAAARKVVNRQRTLDSRKRDRKDRSKRRHVKASRRKNR